MIVLYVLVAVGVALAVYGAGYEQLQRHHVRQTDRQVHGLVIGLRAMALADDRDRRRHIEVCRCNDGERQAQRREQLARKHLRDDLARQGAQLASDLEATLAEIRALPEQVL